MSTSDQL